MDSLTCEILRWSAIEIEELSEEAPGFTELSVEYNRKYDAAMAELGEA